MRGVNLRAIDPEQMYSVLVTLMMEQRTWSKEQHDDMLQFIAALAKADGDSEQDVMLEAADPAMFGLRSGPENG